MANKVVLDGVRWRDVPGFAGYRVSELGEVQSSKFFKTWRTRKVTINSEGYANITLSKGGKMSTHKVHRLVMLAFVGPSELTVDHINGDKTDNRLCNLEYVTNAENLQRAYANGQRGGKKGRDNPASKLSEQDIPVIRRMLDEGHYATTIARRFDVSQGLILHIKHGRAWCHVA